jgi:hypothetical protein
VVVMIPIRKHLFAATGFLMYRHDFVHKKRNVCGASKKLFCKQRSMGLWTVGRLRSGVLSPEMPEATMPRT